MPSNSWPTQIAWPLCPPLVLTSLHLFHCLVFNLFLFFSLCVVFSWETKQSSPISPVAPSAQVQSMTWFSNQLLFDYWACFFWYPLTKLQGWEFFSKVCLLFFIHFFTCRVGFLFRLFFKEWLASDNPYQSFSTICRFFISPVDNSRWFDWLQP